MIQKRIYNYFDRNPQLRVLFVFDKMGGFEAELQDSSWKDEYIYHVFDGKWFKTGVLGTYEHNMLYINGRIKNLIIDIERTNK